MSFFQNHSTARQLLLKATDLLTIQGVESPQTEARWLLFHTLNWSNTQFLTRADETISDTLIEHFTSLFQQRLEGRPVQYICGTTEFFGYEFLVGEGVLIPRPETEILVEKALRWINGRKLALLDLCTGSGIIPITLKLEAPQLTTVQAVDLSPDALHFAHKNNEIRLNHASRIKIFEGDLFSPLLKDQKFDLITTNPPYVTEAEYLTLHHQVKAFEPKLALTAPDEGLAIVRRIAEIAPNYLNPAGALFCEIGAEQGPAARQIFAKYFENAEIIQDLTGRDRIIFAEHPNQ